MSQLDIRDQEISSAKILELLDIPIVHILEMCEDNAWNVTINTRTNGVAIDTGTNEFKEEDVTRVLTLEDLLLRSCVRAMGSVREINEGSIWEYFDVQQIKGEAVKVICQAPALNAQSIPGERHIETLQNLEHFGYYQTTEDDYEKCEISLCKQNGSWVYTTAQKINVEDRVFYIQDGEKLAMPKDHFLGMVKTEDPRMDGWFLFRELKGNSV